MIPTPSSPATSTARPVVPEAAFYLGPTSVASDQDDRGGEDRRAPRMTGAAKIAALPGGGPRYGTPVAGTALPKTLPGSALALRPIDAERPGDERVRILPEARRLIW